MKFRENDVVELRNPESKYFGVKFKVHIDEELEYENLIQIEDPHGRLLTVSEEFVEYCEHTNPYSYRGYTSSVEFDEESNCYHGHLLGIPDLVTWEAATVEDCLVEFRKSVDDYEEMLEFVDEEFLK